MNEPIASAGATPAGKPRRQWLTVLLFISLVANVFLIGLVGGRILHRHGWLPGEGGYMQQFGPMAGHALQRVLSPLDGSDRKIVLDSVLSHAEELQKISTSIREQREVVARLLKADPFDRKAVDEAFGELRRRSDSLLAVLQAALGDGVEKLSPDARKRLED